MRTRKQYQEQAVKMWKKRRKPLAQRFWEKVNIKGPDECWPWMASKNAGGYGKFGLGKTNYLAHRIAMMLSGNNPEPDDCVLHRCDNPACCNTKHLFIGTRVENNEDRHKKGRSKGPDWKHHRATKLNPELVREIRRLRVQSGYSLAELGRRYGVAKRTILSITKRHTWKHI